MHAKECQAYTGPALGGRRAHCAQRPSPLVYQGTLPLEPLAEITNRGQGTLPPA